MLGISIHISIDKCSFTFSFRPQIQETVARVWVTYFENERKCTISQTEKIQNQLQSKLQKVGHGVTGVLRLASRKQKKDVAVKASSVSLQVNDFYLFYACK